MHAQIHSALIATFAFSGWRFDTESEFKHELFHQLAIQQTNGVPLGCAGLGELTPILHAEGKVENGNPAKADILLCDPRTFQEFNYKACHIIELKKSLTRQALALELKKIDSYQNQYESIWLASSTPLSLSQELIPTRHSKAERFHVIGPEAEPELISVETNATDGPAMVDVANIARECIDTCLNLYGTGKAQYQSYFWCNFEHEQERRHSYPCEGDFNSQLYHHLRQRLPLSVRIHSEYSPRNLPRRRIDFLLQGPGEEWAIPIETKMNWDQFKPKYKNRQLIRSEAGTIMDRFDAVQHEFVRSAPMLVVIQGQWRRQTKMQNKENALRELGESRFPIEFVCFHEGADSVQRIALGG
jgi:hypothetical protein